MKEPKPPTIAKILTLLGDESIIVGSAAYGFATERKDIDLVVSKKGLDLLKANYEYWMNKTEGSETYIVWCKEKIIDVFHGKLDCLCPIKNANRVSYEEINKIDLPRIGVYGPQMRVYRR